MTLKNGNFENGWSRDTWTGQQFGEIFVPQDWVAFWFEEDDTFLYRPEMHVIQNVEPYINPPRIYDVGYALKFFKQWGNIDAGIFQQVDAKSGATVKFSAYGHAWYSQRDNAFKSEYEKYGKWHTIRDGDPGVAMMVGIDPYGGTNPTSPNVVWEVKSIYDTYDKLEVSAEAKSDLVTVFIRSASLYRFKHVDVYWDKAEMEVFYADVKPSRGAPRVQYDRTYWLLSQDATEADLVNLAKLVYPNRGTIGFSADDSGIGDLDARNVQIVWTTLNSWKVEGEHNIEFWLDQHYPGVKYYHYGLNGIVPPVDTDDPIGDDPITPPTPDPDPIPDEQPSYTLRSKNLIGLHSGYAKEGWDVYLRDAKPNLVKVFSGGFAEAAKRIAPDALVVWRRHSDNEVDTVGNLSHQVDKLISLYDAELEAMAKNSGRSIEDVLQTLNGVVIESVNEKIPTFNIPVLQNCVEFDTLFAQRVKARYDGYLVPGGLTAAIGNPHESEVHIMAPAVQAIINANGFVGYHGYWTANRDNDWLDAHWPYHAGRWEEWDKVFSEIGLYPKYYLGECGIVYCPSSDGTRFESGEGWKKCGSFERYLRSIVKFNENILEWNKTHGNRCFGGTLFGFGNWGWNQFEIGTGDLVLLRERMKQIM